MHELSDDARTILDLVRDVDDPTDRDKKRVTRAMIAQIGVAAVVSSSATMAAASGGAGTVAAATGVSLGTKVLASVAVAGLVAGGAVLQRTSSVAPPVRPSAAVVARAAQPEPAAPIVEAAAPAVREPTAEASPAETSPAEAPPVETPRRTAPRSHAPAAQEALALEVSVLGSVRSALRAGEPLRALALLDAHRATFARGMLREEYLAARVMALRDLGRRDEAAAAATQFAAEMPHSPLAAELASRTEAEARP
jgi:hypothetical protein